MTRGSLSTLVLVLLPTFLAAQDLQRCVAIENDIARLECFDTQAQELSSSTDSPVALEAESDAPGSEASGFAAWEKDEERDPISDRRNVSYFAEPTEPQYNQFNMRKTVFLQLRCFDNTTAVVLFFDEYQISDRIALSIRLDDAEATEATWGISGNRQAAGLWNGRTSIPFVKSLVGSDRLAVRAFLDDGAETYLFDTSNVDEYAADIAEACNWELE